MGLEVEEKKGGEAELDKTIGSKPDSNRIALLKPSNPLGHSELRHLRNSHRVVQTFFCLPHFGIDTP